MEETVQRLQPVHSYETMWSPWEVGPRMLPYCPPVKPLELLVLLKREELTEPLLSYARMCELKRQRSASHRPSCQLL